MSGRVRVKICGLTNRADAEAAISAGADALGFNTWREGKRFIDLDREATWLRELPPFVTRVALLVNAPLAEAERISRLPFIDALQLHGDEDERYCAAVAEFGRPFVKALRVGSVADFERADAFRTRSILLDAQVAGAFGGTGTRLDLDLVRQFQGRHPDCALVLAGGLRPESVQDAVRAVRPYAVDVSSGVEISPGRKDPEMMRAFIAAAHCA